MNQPEGLIQPVREPEDWSPDSWQRFEAVQQANYPDADELQRALGRQVSLKSGGYLILDQTEAMTMGTRSVILRDGEIMQIASPREAYDYPANLFTAQFIGSPQMNIFKGRAYVDGDFYSIALENGYTVKTNSKTDGSSMNNGYNGRVVYWGIRPEYIQEGTQGHRFKRFSEIVGSIHATELIGAETYLHFNLQGQTVIARVDSHLNIKVGDKVTFHLPADCIYMFDVDSERAIG
jgi:multiple sugar transport system ATP-binding protein